MSGVHPMAVVAPGARLGADVEIGPFVFVGPHVTLGDGVIDTQIGRNPAAALGDIAPNMGTVVALEKTPERLGYVVLLYDLLNAIVVLVILAFFLKAAIVPFHAWAPETAAAAPWVMANAAPTPRPSFQYQEIRSR